MSVPNPPRARPIPETPDPVVIHYRGPKWACDIEIPKDRWEAAKSGLASLLVHDCVLRGPGGVGWMVRFGEGA